MAKVQFTPQEEALLTPFDCAAADYMRVEAKENDQIPPAWLCASDEARDRARKGAVETLRTGLGDSSISLEWAKAFVESHIPMRSYTLWKEMELALKQARSENNPRAFFVG